MAQEIPPIIPELTTHPTRHPSTYKQFPDTLPPFLRNDDWFLYKGYLQEAHLKSAVEAKTYVDTLHPVIRKFIVINWARECGSSTCSFNGGKCCNLKGKFPEK